MDSTLSSTSGTSGTATVTGPQTQRDLHALQLCEEAFHAEFEGNFVQAYHCHAQAVAALHTLVEDSRFLDRERKRVAKKQLKFHQARLNVVRPLKDGITNPSFVMLPSVWTAREEFREMRTGPLGQSLMAITFDDIWLANFQKQKEEEPGLAPEQTMAHLLQTPVPYYSPTLPSKEPATVYHISVSQEKFKVGSFMYYIKVKSDTPERQTLYTLQAHKRTKHSIDKTSLYRATEFTKRCQKVVVTPVKPGFTEIEDSFKGRPMTVYNDMGGRIEEQPDRLEKPGWGPRRFVYGGRNFVWVTEGTNEWVPQTLYEVSEIRPKPRSRTGKKEHTVIGSKICWGEGRFGLRTSSVLCIAAGVDQVFREHILSVQLTRFAIILHGHDK